MSDTNKQNQGVQPGTNGNEEGNKTGEQEFFLVRWGKAAGAKIGEGLKVIKEHPVAIALSTALGVTAGGVVTYKVMNAVNANASDVPEVSSPALIPEKVEENDEESNRAEYVDIPEDSTTEA